jgi:ribonuclease D
MAIPLPDPQPREISREEVASLPIRRYEGSIALVRTLEDARKALEDILKERVVGFDTETRPAFRKGQTYLPCLVQIATAGNVYLFQLERTDFTSELRQVLESAEVKKAGVAIADDLRQLQALFAFEAHGVIDPGRVARRHGFPQTGLRNLAAIFLGFRIPKGNRTSNWAARELNSAQINYAATDAWACRELFLRFEEMGLLEAPPPD